MRMQEEFEWLMMTLYMFINNIGSSNSNLSGRIVPKGLAESNLSALKICIAVDKEKRL